MPVQPAVDGGGDCAVVRLEDPGGPCFSLRRGQATVAGNRYAVHAFRDGAGVIQRAVAVNQQSAVAAQYGSHVQAL